MPTCFDHESLDVYRLAIRFVVWTETLEPWTTTSGKKSVLNQLDRASTSIPLNIAEGIGKRSHKDRCRCLDIARGSALECAACLDVLVARGMVTAVTADRGKQYLIRVVQMLTRLVARLLGSDQ